MRRFIVFVFWVAFVCVASGQSYKQIWQDVDNAVRSDLPKTAIGLLQQIRSKSQAEGEKVQELRATIMLCKQYRKISLDSVQQCLLRMEHRVQCETDNIMRSLWHQTLMKLYGENSARDTASLSAMRRHLHASLKPFADLAAARVKPYQELFERGDGDKYFHNDLLSVIAREVLQQTGGLQQEEKDSLFATLIRHYKSSGNRCAALLWTLDSIAASPFSYDNILQNPSYLALCKVAAEYQDLSLNVQTYLQFLHFTYLPEGVVRDSVILAKVSEGLKKYRRTAEAKTLKQYIRIQQLKTIDVKGVPSVLFPGEKARLFVSGKNVQRAELRFYRLHLNSVLCDKVGTSENGWKQFRQDLSASYAINMPPSAIFLSQCDTLEISLSEPGVYECALFVDGKFRNSQVVRVSNVRPIWIAESQDTVRCVLVEAKSGNVIFDGELEIFDEKYSRITSLRSDERGVFRLSQQQRGLSCYPKTPTDAYMSSFTPYAYYNYNANIQRGRNRTTLQLFSDRTIYRPGQMIHVGGMVYTQQGDDYKIEAKFPVSIGLYDVNNEEVARLETFSDEMGVFNVDFTLPRQCLTGNFWLRAKGKGSQFAQISVKVEEYKMPTFSVQLGDPKVPYAMGDTVRLEGAVKSYVDLPLANAKVKWNVNRRLWRSMMEQSSISSGECVTDVDGKFVVPVFLSAAKAVDGHTQFYRYTYTINYSVTAENGETVSGDLVLQAGKDARWLDAAWPSVVCKERLPQLSVHCFNAAGKPLQETLDYSLWHYTTDATGTVLDSLCVAKGNLVASTPAAIPVLQHAPSGRYVCHISLLNHEDTLPYLRQPFLLFSENDKKVPDSSHFWHYVKHNEQGDSALILVGSACKDVTLFCDKFANGKLVDSRRVAFTDSVVRLQLDYHPSYGESARLCCAFLKEGKMYAFETDIKKPVPEKKLLLKWETFRSHLNSGSTEDWTLSVTHSDGSPANASVMARLYDASLDVFLKKPWRISGVVFPRGTVNSAWEALYPYKRNIYFVDEMDKKSAVRPLAFTHWDNTLFFDEIYTVFTGPKLTSRNIRMSAAESVKMKDNIADVNYTVAARADDAAVLEKESVALATGGEASMDFLRTNFSETAYFALSLRTDTNGRVQLRFTLPQSLTTWQFEALAHTEDMKHGRMDTTVVARKDFMVQPAMPRFVRMGDSMDIPVTLTKLSETAVVADVTLTLTDERTGKALCQLAEKCELKDINSATLHFVYDVPNIGDFTRLVCRVTAQSQHFQDGEEHYLPVLSNRVEVRRTLPFSMLESGNRVVRLDTLWHADAAQNHRLVIETTSHPTWLAVQTLPVLTDKRCYGAMDWAAQYYALQVAHHIALQHPTIKEAVLQQRQGADNFVVRNLENLDNSTPWLGHAEREALRVAELSNLFDEGAWAVKEATAYEQLAALQNADGSWSWFKGMKGHFSMTMDVAVLLARLAHQTGHTASSPLLTKGLRYIDAEISQQVQLMRKSEQQVKAAFPISEHHVDYLYLCALQGRELNDAAKWLLDAAACSAEKTPLPMKPRLAVVMAKYGNEKLSQMILRSLSEYQISSDEMGDFYDGEALRGQSASIRTQMQVATIEALGLQGDTYSSKINAMKLWLMYTLRTQLWSEALQTSDVLYALLLENRDSIASIKRLDEQSVLYYTLTSGNRILDAPSQKMYSGKQGYLKKDYDESVQYLFAKKGETQNPVHLKIRQNTSGLSWGNATVTYTLPLDAVSKTGAGFALDVQHEVWRNGKWQRINELTTLAVGERVRTVVYIQSDKDYQFVCLDLQHAGGLVPTHALSGYKYSGDLWAYRAVEDTKTLHFIEEIRKGRFAYVEEYVVNRPGAYAWGLSEIRCLLAPEYQALGNAIMKQLVVE